MTVEKQEEIRDYLRGWSEDDWDEVDRLRGVMPIPEALVQVHKRKVSEAPLPSTEVEEIFTVVEHHDLILL